MRFDAERKRHFPAVRNCLSAHLTLFHHLPGHLHLEIAEELAVIARRSQQIPLSVPSIRFLGHGVAYTVVGPKLLDLRAELARRWTTHLTRQDAQGFRPHVTIQNKVAAEAARSLFESLSDKFEPFEALGTGLLLWRYRGGPWEAAGEHAFAA